MNHVYRSPRPEPRYSPICLPYPARVPGGRLRPVVLALSAAAMATLAVSAHALPQGPQVSTGQGSVAQSGSTLVVTQQSQNLGINWQSFGIGGNESVVFAQPSTSSIALNRVLGTGASQIDGRLLANGQVWLLNPNGVIFGNGAQVNVGGLVATTLGLSDADFLAGRRTFSGNAGLVINQGKLMAADGGYVALLGGRVSNEGVIQAQLGTVAMAAGQQVRLDFAGDQLLGVQVDRGVVDALVQNRQLIQADGGRVAMTTRAADTVLGGVVNNEGVVVARTIDTHTGTIQLLASENGGKVQESGTLDASAPSGGNGGSIETSAGRVSVVDGARISTEAPQGTTGTWVIDPTDYTIAPTDGDITGTALAARLADNNVVLLSSNGQRAGLGDIRVLDSVRWNSPNSLTLSALRNVTVARPISNRGTGGVTLRADNEANCRAGSATCGTVRFVGNGRVSVNGGDVDIYYNPPGSNRVAGANGNGPSYAAPTDFSPYVRLGGKSELNAWMLVNDVNQLQAVNTNRNGSYALGRDIDAATAATWNGGRGFRPISNFSGRFDGSNGVISNLTINRPDDFYIGLFRIVNSDGSIANVQLKDARVSGYSAGALVGENRGSIDRSTSVGAQVRGSYGVGGLVGGNRGLVTNSSSLSGTVSGRTNVGGLVGQNFNRITGGRASGAVAGLASGSGQIGGLVGDNGGVVTDGRAIATVQGNGYVGGLAGTNSGIIRRGDARGTVIGQDSVGGLAGYNTSGALITGSRSGARVVGGTDTAFGGLVGRNGGNVDTSASTGSVSGTDYVGGLVGISFGRIRNTYATGNVRGSRYVGGLAGYNAGSIASSYSSGRVQGLTYVGGFAGSNTGRSAADYWNTERSGTTTGVGIGRTAGITGLTTSQMRQKASFVGFDFTNTWNIIEGVTSPFLINR